MGDLETVKKQEVTTVFSEPWLVNLRRALGTTQGRPVLQMGMEITPDQREAINQKLLTLRQQITVSGPTEREQIGRELLSLITAFPTDVKGNEAAALRISAYSDAIGDAPAWAVYQARLKIVRGEVEWGNRSFAPSPPQVAEFVQAELRLLKKDLTDLGQLAAVEKVKVISPEVRKKVHEGLKELGDKLGGRQLPPAVVAEAAEAALRQRATKLGLDPDATMAALPDAPDRSSL